MQSIGQGAEDAGVGEVPIVGGQSEPQYSDTADRTSTPVSLYMYPYNHNKQDLHNQGMSLFPSVVLIILYAGIEW